MPLYTGAEINLPNFHIPSAAPLLHKLSRSDTYGIRAYDASLGGRNIRVANRRIVISTLKKSLAFDSSISCFDINIMAGILAICIGKMIHVWNCETYILKNSLGKAGGSLHKDSILSCCINLIGTKMATCGNDQRIIVWSLEQWKSIKLLEGHRGAVYQVEFSVDSEYIYSSSDDGRVVKWDWKSGSMINTCMRHPFAVRSFDFNFERPEIIVCGRSDGYVTVWNIDHFLRIDNIIPDPNWMQNTIDDHLIGWADKDKNHSGSILCVRVSPNNRYLATGASDNTCKIWNIISYKKSLDTVQRELQQADAILKKLNGYIDVTDTVYDEQLKYQEYSTLKIGEVSLSSGYHADLRCTLRHEAPVLSVRFTCSSDITVTGCMDSTCRLWSSRRGELLFQINTPAPVTMVQVDICDHIYLSCQNRLLIFGIKALFKEDDLPLYWQHSEIKQRVEHIMAGKNTTRTVSTNQPVLPLALRTVSLNELRRLIAHGLVLPRFLETLSNQFNESNNKQLEINMRRYNVSGRQVLRLITNSKFHPKDILKALSSKGNTSILYSLILHGNAITGYMLKLGYEQLDDNRDKSQIQIDFRDFQPPSLFQRNKDRHMHSKPHGDFDYEKWWQGWYSEKDQDNMDNDYDDEDDELGARPPTQPKGKVLHFIPSMQMKLLKDLKAKRDVKPIFLRQLAVETEQGRIFPNFDPHDNILDQRPILPKHAVPKQGVRFNESIIGKSNIGKRQDARERDNGPRPVPLGEYATWKESLSSSQTIFKPERYFQARGLNVTFDADHSAAVIGLPSSNELQTHGHVFFEPILIRQNRDRDEKHQMVVGEQVAHQDGVLGQPSLA
ncbi:hypothetical protein BDEG_20886 [Batrachochytrium dendrobatidis JEL423]|uniref:Uncharacterized protein n=1 Tax=Batrachochytrium dendrobatidis (strain JEL423) TaxID=403673 RepID=A0A177WAI7_BATDL|nr:hypothetical protein BDEG_20886 [Batrachochytrium dendrobatidis JEL423]